MLLHNFFNFRALWIPSSITAKSRWQDYQAVSFGLSTSMPRKWIFMDLEVRSFISKAKWKPSRLTWQIIYSAWNHCNALFCCCNSRNAVFPFFAVVDLCSTIGSCNNVFTFYYICAGSIIYLVLYCRQISVKVWTGVYMVLVFETLFKQVLTEIWHQISKLSSPKCKYIADWIVTTSCECVLWFCKGIFMICKQYFRILFPTVLACFEIYVTLHQ